MLRGTLTGLVAGSVGTVALNVAAYADMAIRGRPSSNAPAQMVETVADKVGLAPSAQEDDAQKQTAKNRESGIGALLGYVNGLAVGALYGLASSQGKNVPAPVAGVLVGASAMAASDVPLVALRVSNPKKWGISGWAADAIPHLIYGAVTVLTWKVLMGRKAS